MGEPLVRLRLPDRQRFTGEPTDADRPTPSTFPGRRGRLIEGQLMLDEQGGDDAA
jgi:hypothetical protein